MEGYIKNRFHVLRKVCKVKTFPLDDIKICGDDMKICGEVELQFHSFLTSVLGGGEVVSFTSWTLCLQEKYPPLPIEYEAVWAPDPV